jgi:hypothetical protein
LGGGTAQGGERLLEVRGRSALDRHAGTRDRVREGEPVRVEHRAAREGPAAGGLAVDRVAEDRQAHVREVDADLVLAARLELHLQEGGPGSLSRTRQCVRAGCEPSPGFATPRRPLTHSSRIGASTVPLSASGTPSTIAR